MNFPYLFVALFATSISHIAFAGSNLMSCDSDGRYLKNCKLQGPAEVAQKPLYESDFLVTYSNTCFNNLNKPVKSTIRAFSGTTAGQYLSFNAKESEMAAVTGSEALVLVQEKPTEIVMNRLPECSLVVSVTTRPSSGTIGLWSERNTSIDNQLAALQKAESAWKALSSYSNAFILFDRVIGVLTTDLKTQVEALKALRDLQKCSDETINDPLCLTYFDKVASAPAELFSESEIDKINRLKKAMDKLNSAIVDACTSGDEGSCKTSHEFLMKMFKPEEVKVLEDAQANIEKVKNSATELTKVKATITALQAEQAELHKTAGVYLK